MGSKYAPMSADDMRKYLPDTHVILYGQLAHFHSLDQLLGPQKHAVILYEMKAGFGHWTCVFRRSPDLVECFDSYGKFLPDSELKLIPKQFRVKSGQDKTLLLRLLDKDGCNVDYNDYPLQSWDARIATCGRWCIARLAYPDLSIDQFWSMMNVKGRDDVVAAAIP